MRCYRVEKFAVIRPQIAVVGTAEAVGADPILDPGSGSQGEVVPPPCHEAACTVTLDLRSTEGDEFARFTYRD